MSTRRVLTDVPKEMDEQLSPRCANINQQFRILSDLVSRHFDTLSHEWKSRNEKTRRKLLRTVWGRQDGWGKMLLSRPDVNEVSPQRARYMWPHLNQEDLAADPGTFLTFCRNRATFEPTKYLLQDLVSTKDGWPKLVVEEWMEDISDKLMSSISDCDIEAIGEPIVTLHSIDETQASGKHFVVEQFALDFDPPPEALNTKETAIAVDAQERIYTFLVEVCFALLEKHGVNRDNVADFPQQTLSPHPSPRKHSLCTGGPDVLYKRRRVAFYGPPRTPDWTGIRQLLQSKLDDAEATFRAFRAIPDRFEATVRLLADVDPAAPRGAGGEGQKKKHRHKDSEDLEAALNDRRLGDAVRQAVMSEIMRVDSWSGLMTAFDRLDAKLNSASSRPGAHVECEISVFVWRAEALCTMLVNELKRLLALPASKKLPKALDGKMQMLFEVARNNFAVARLVDGVEKVVENNNLAHCLSSDVMEILGDLGVLAECLTLVEHYHCWFNKVIKTVRKDKKIQEKALGLFLEFRTAWKYMDGVDAWREAVPLGVPIEGRFRYPVDEPRSHETVEILRSSEANLDKFWTVLIRDLDKVGGLSPVVKEVLSHAPTRTPEWSPPPASSAAEDAAEDVEGSSPEDSPERRKTALWYQRTDTARDEPAAARKEPNTGPEEETAAEEAQPAESSSEGGERVLVSRATWDSQFLQFLFYDPDQPSRPAGELAWSDFLKAMLDLGFTATRPGGSQYNFFPDPDGPLGAHASRRAGVFVHRPHPRPNFALRDCRMYGQWMADTYGWTIRSFALRPRQ